MTFFSAIGQRSSKGIPQTLQTEDLCRRYLRRPKLGIFWIETPLEKVHTLKTPKGLP